MYTIHPVLALHAGTIFTTGYDLLANQPVADFRGGLVFFGNVLAKFHSMAHEFTTRNYRGFDLTKPSGTASQTLCAAKSLDIISANPTSFHFFQAIIAGGIDDDRLYCLDQI